MRIPMPSPTGTNRAGLFIDRPRAGAAYDEKLPDDAAAELYAFLSGKLSAEDLAEFCRMAGVDPGLSMDAKRNRFRMALDGRLGAEAQWLARSDRYSVEAKSRMFNSAAPTDPSFAQRFPNAARVKTSF